MRLSFFAWLKKTFAADRARISCMSIVTSDRRSGGRFGICDRACGKKGREATCSAASGDADAGGIVMSRARRELLQTARHKWLCRKVEYNWYKISGSAGRLDDKPCLFPAENIGFL
jgi:hypothetical protein